MKVNRFECDVTYIINYVHIDSEFLNFFISLEMVGRLEA